MVPLYKVYMPENIAEECESILYSGKLTYGKYAAQFEQGLRDYIGNQLFLTTSNNNFALLIALKVINIKPEDEVIASPVSCLATNQPVVTSGAQIVWADIDPATGTLDPDSVKEKITSKTRAILHYHWAGYPGYIDEINKLAGEHGITVIEDATEAFGAEYKGHKIGNTGSDIVCFSYQPVRLPNSIEGGGIAFNSRELYEKALLMRDYGIDRSRFRDEMGEISPRCNIELPGFNAMMNEVNGYIGFRQLEDLKGLLDRQSGNAARLYETLGNHEFFRGMKRFPGIKPSFWVFTLLADDPVSMIRYFRNNGVYASRVHLRNDHYSVLSKSLAHELAGVNEFAGKEFCIPSGWWLYEEHIDKIITLIKNYKK